MRNLFVMRRGLAALALLLAATGPAMAGATSEQYRGCDGYGAASLEGDGMTSYATVLLIFSPPNWGNTSQAAARAGASGIADCDAALSDLSERHWMRKVSLLRARAIHRLETRDTQGALADLDLAVAAAHDDPHYARSLGLGVTLTRAYALRLAGEQAKADALIAAVLKERPYNRQANIDALIAGGPAGDPQVFRSGAQALLRLVPLAAQSLYEQAFDHSLFDDVAALHAMLPTASSGGLKDRKAFARGEGIYAYALAVQGHGDEAHAVLAAARERLGAPVAAAEPEAAIATDDKDGTSDAETSEGNTPGGGATRANEAENILHAWQTITEWRLQVAHGAYAEVLKALHATRLPKGPMSVELLTALAAAVPEKLKTTVPPIDPVRPDAATSADEEARLLGLFFQNLPGAETAHNIPSFSDKGWLDTNGASVTEEKGLTTVTFRGAEGTPSVMEEMTLLKAAELAHTAGKTGIIVMRRHDVEYSVTTTYYGTPLRTDPNGFSTGLTVQFADTLPDAYKATPWRMIDADDVLQRLGPIYHPGRKN